MSEGERANTESPEDEPAVPADLRPCLVPLYPEGPAVGIRFPLPDTPYVLGTDPSCDLHLPDGAVASPRHARLDPGPDGPMVVSLEGSIFVNDKSVTGPLRSGDCLRLGQCLVRYLAGAEGEVRYREELYRLKAFDPWTGLHGRRYLIDFLHRELFATHRSRRALSLATFELDDASGLTARLGPLASELAQRQVADCVRRSIRKADLIAVTGAGRFAVCMYKARAEDAVHLTERLRRLVAEHEFFHGSDTYRATLSAGLATTRGEPPLTPSELLALAEAKLLEAQAAGGNCTVQ